MQTPRIASAVFLIGCLLANHAVVAQPPESWAVRIVFGTDDKEPTDWSGKIAGPADVLDRIDLESWRFATGLGDTLEPARKAWKVQTRLGIAPLERQPVQGADNPPARQIPWPVGVTVIGRGLEPDRLAVETAQGNCEFSVRELQWGKSLKLRQNVQVERTVPPVAPVARPDDHPAHDDFPALLGTRAGELWLAWISFEGDSDQILVTRRHRDGWSGPTVISPPGDHASVALAEDGRGTVWAVWSQQVEGNWDLFARFWNGKQWSKAIRLTEDPGSDIHPAAASAEPDMAVVWQGFRDGQSDVFFRRVAVDDSGRLKEAPAIKVSTSPANDWMPAVATDRTGAIHVAWDTYDRGNYDVLLRSVRGGELSPILPVATSPLFESQPSVACDDRGRVWVAYDEGTTNWGKDFGFWWWIDKWPQGTRLYERRQFAVRCFDPGAPGLALPDPFQGLPLEFREFCEQPIVRADARGRVWVFFRHRTAKNPRADGWAAAGWWELYALWFDGQRWSEPISFPRSFGRQSQPSAAVPTKDGFAVAWGSDGRTFQQPADGIRTRLHAGIIRGDQVPSVGEGVKSSSLKLTNGSYVGSFIHPNEVADVKRIRDYSITVGGKKLKIYRGDLHRHTEISTDGVGDGTLADLYRYALDAASLDYILVGDHGMGSDRDYPWWRTQKSNDMYHLAGRFVPMYGYERSIRYPWGHRNVIWTERGHRTFPTTKAKGEPAKKAPPAKKKAVGPVQPAEDDTLQLYAYLRKNGGIVTLHTSASDQGTNWETGFDPELEPFVEIFQGYHTSYEGPGTPLAIDDKTAIVHGPYRPAGFVWNALEKGYRLGFQASSDHIATHNSYACVWAESLDRRSLVAGMKKRHSYAATDNIILDVRSGEHMMGDEFTASGPITLDVKIFGTAPLARVEIIRNKEVVYSHDAKDSSAAEFRWTDMQSRRAGDTSYYYVRVQQADRQMAWASPLWVK